MDDVKKYVIYRLGSFSTVIYDVRLLLDHSSSDDYRAMFCVTKVTIYAVLYQKGLKNISICLFSGEYGMLNN